MSLDYYTGSRIAAPAADVETKIGISWTDAPVEGAKVTLGKESVKTAADGTYTFDAVTEGEHTVTVTKDGYEDASQTITVAGSDLTVGDITLNEAAPVETATLKTDAMSVEIKQNFPSVLQYTMKSGKIMYGQSKDVRTVEINGTNVELTDDDVTFEQVSDTKAEYTLTVKDAKADIDAVLTVQILVDANTLDLNVTEITNNLNDPHTVGDLAASKYYADAIQTVSFPNQSLVSVRADADDAQFTGAVMSSNTQQTGDEHFAITEDTTVDSDYMYAFVSGSGLSAGLWSNSEHEGRVVAAPVRGGSHNTRVQAVTQSVGDTTSLGLSSEPYYYQRSVTDSKGNKYTVVETDMPKMSVAIAEDENDDGAVNWQDGALAYRDIMNNPYKSEEVPELVAWRIAMNFGGQAQNPFLTTLDNVKKVALNTDGLGQSVLLEGYGNEGHDSGHPDYADIGERLGGAEDMHTLMEEGAEYGARFGIHVNASEMYPEAKAFNEDMVRRNASGGLSYGWNWLDQGIGIDGIYDLASGSRASRFAELKEQVGDNMDFIYLDVWGNLTSSSSEDSWETRKMSKMINDNGWRMTTEWGSGNEYDSTFQHWAADLTYGGYTSKGENSQVMRFLRNHQKDSWVGDYPSYGGAAVAPLLGGYNMKDFEGWQGRNDYAAYIENLYTHDVSTKFIQHFKVTRWVNNPLDPTSTTDPNTNNGNEQIELKDDEGDECNTVVISRGSNDISDLAAYRDRTITLNGKVVATGAVRPGDEGNSAVGTESYLLPWLWDASTGKFVDSSEEKLYHWNTRGGETTWTLPDSWSNLSSVKVYTLTDQGKTDEQTVAVTGGKVTLTAEAQTPYVVYRGEAKQLSIDWSTGMHVVDAGFNGGQDTLTKNWTVEGSGTAEVEGDNNAMLRLTGKVEVSQKITDLTPGDKYALYLGVDNRTAGEASVTVTSDGKTLATNSTGTSIAKNYIKAYGHNTNSDTEDGSSYFQNMYVWFTAPESGTAEVTMALDSTDEEHAYFDDVRVVENDYDGVAYDKDGELTKLTNDFENNAQGIWPFVISGIEGVEDNRTHLSELHDPYTQAGWDVKQMDDVLDGNWSVKVNGLVQRGTLVYQTVPQNVQFEAGEKYKVSFDYQSGSDGIYAIATGQGEYSDDSVALTPLDKHLGTDGHAEFELTGGLNNDSWFGIYSTTTAPDYKASDDSTPVNSGSNEANFGGYKDFVLDNLSIERIESEAKTKAEAEAKLEEIRAKYDDKRAEYSDEVWQSYQDALVEVQVLINKNGANGDDFTKAYNLLTAIDEYMTTHTGNADSDAYDVAMDGADGLGGYTVEAGSAQGQSGNEGPVEFAQDGSGSTHWHTAWSVDSISAGNAWYQFNLEEPTTIDGLRYLPREGGVNKNGKILGYYVTLTLADGTEITKAAEGEFSASTVWQKVSFEPVENVVKVRLTATSSTGQSEGEKNHYASAAELRVTTNREIEVETPDVNKADLKEALDQANALNEADYTADSWAPFAEARTAAQNAYDDEQATAYDVALALANLETAMAGLEQAEEPGPGPVVVDKTDLRTALNKAADLKEADYTADSWAAFAKARKAAQAVMDDANATQQDVDAALKALEQAIADLKPASGEKPEPGEVSKSELDATIAKAEAIDLSGYTDASAKALREALKHARAVSADADATQDEVDAAFKALQQAIDGLTKRDEQQPDEPGQPGKPSISDTGAAVAAVAVAGLLLAAAGVALTRRRHRG